jgi:hypothetical protein
MVDITLDHRPVPIERSVRQLSVHLDRSDSVEPSASKPRSSPPTPANKLTALNIQGPKRSGTKIEHTLSVQSTHERYTPGEIHN